MRLRLKRKFGLVLYTMLIVFLSVLLFFEIGMVKSRTKSEGVAYREEPLKISYKVLLKPNNYYETQYLDETYNAIANLIDQFILSYKYQNTFSSEVDYKVKYGVTAELVVYDSNNDDKPIYTKPYTLIETKEISGRGLMAKIDDNDNGINYNDYNAIVSELKREVLPNAILIIKFNTEFKASSDKVEKEFGNKKNTSITIPISQKTIGIAVDKKLDNASEGFIPGKTIVDPASLVLAIGTSVILCLSMIKFSVYIIKTAKKKSKYDQAVSKILREFDRTITEAKGKLRIDKDANTIEVKDFMELLDAHDNFNIPIIYYKLSNHMCVFLVKKDNDIFYNVMKSDDYE